MTISKKSFYQQLEELLDKYDLEQLNLVIRNMADNIVPDKREEFLSKIEIKKDVEIVLDFKIVSSIEDLISDILGGNHEDEWNNEVNYEEKDNYWDDDCFLSPKSDLFEEIEYLFDESSKLFDAKEYKISYFAYEKLFELVKIAEEEGSCPSLSDSSLKKLEIKEIILKYIQSAYRISKSSDRISIGLKIMKENSYYINEQTFLSNLDEVSLNPLPEFDDFLLKIIGISNKNISDIPYELFLEAVKLSKGVDGLRKVSETHGKKQPQSYLVLLEELYRKEQYNELVEIAKQGILSISINHVKRAEISDYLTIIGQINSDIDLQQLGLINSIESRPNISKLIDLYYIVGEKWQDAYQKTLKRLKTINKMKSSISSDTPNCSDRLLAQAAILAKNVSFALEITDRHKILGWSDRRSPSGIIVAVMLKLLSNFNKKVPIIDELIIWELESKEFLNLDTSKKFIEILNSIHTSHSLGSDRLIEYRNWCINKIKERCDAIISNKYRQSYFKAAHLLTGLREMYYSNNLVKVGDELITIFNEKYSRHRSFRTELNKKLNKSIY